MSVTVDLSSAEQQAYELIVYSEEVYQSELWKALDVSSRQGSRLVQSLSDTDLIERERTVHDGRVTYRLMPSEDDENQMTVVDSEPVETEDHDKPSEAHHEDLKPREQQALSLIQSTGGVYQSELWKELGVSSRTGTRIATALEDAGLVQREDAVQNGHTTYLLTPTPRQRDFSVLMAGTEISPFISTADVDPQSEAFTQWLMTLSRESPE